MYVGSRALHNLCWCAKFLTALISLIVINTITHSLTH